MACRLVNLHKQPLRIDLRGGETLVLPAGQTSRVLREELLYDNFHVRDWEKAGLLARVPARLTEGRPPPSVPASRTAEVSGKSIPEAAAAPRPTRAAPGKVSELARRIDRSLRWLSGALRSARPSGRSRRAISPPPRSDDKPEPGPAAKGRD
jgi:hypothetical protein